MISQNANIKILVVEDEQDINDLLEIYLIKEGYKVFKAFDGEEALAIFKKEKIDIILLDVMIPKIDGFHVLQKIREKSDVPVIFLTARIEEQDRILGLGLGADDYVVKPFGPLEVMARIQSNLRRYINYSKTREDEIISFGDIKINLSSCNVYKKDKCLELNAKEYKILEFLAKDAGRVYTKNQLYEAIWQDSYYGDDNTIMVHISRIREKIEEDPKKPVYLKTIRGIGYKIEKE